MDTNQPKSFEGLKERLDSYYQWPAVFPFKFIVPIEQYSQVVELLDDSNIKEKYSAQRRFVSLTSEKKLFSSDDVIKVYKIMEKIPGIITL